ncbi:MFS transporter [Tsukamurella sp. TY48]|uniref:MFS transporter n=1 Tax=Tsukamurella sp. TY48 TaxID=2775495 RepID=UPI0035B57194
MMAPGAQAQTYRVKGSAIGLAIFVLSGMYFLAVLDGTVVFVAMPVIQEALNLTDAMKVWVFGAYALTFGGFMLLGGRLGDTFGRKKMFILGVLGFTVASGLAGFATSEAFLLAARASQGFFAAIASPTALALIATTFAPGKARNQAFGIFGGMAGLGSVAGLVAGGLLATWDWRLVFWINVPVGLACAIGGYFALDEATSERRHALDVKGAILAVAGCVAGVYALTAGPELHWQSPLVYAALGFSAVCLIAFLIVERTAKNPILPFSLFNNRNRVAAMIGILVCGALIPTLGFYVSLTFQLVLGYSPLQSGLALLPFALGMGISITASTKLVQYIQARWLVAFGGLVVFFPCLYVPTLMSKAPETVAYFPQIAIPVFLIGIGVGFAIVPLPLCALAGVRPTEIGPMSALVEVGQNIGGIVGLASVQVAVTSRIMAEGGPTTGHLKHSDLTSDQISALASGYGLAFISCAVILIIAGLVVVPFMRFTPAEIAEGQMAEASSKSGGVVHSTSFPAQAFDETEDTDDDWEPLEGDVTSGSFAAIRREDFDRAYNERPGDPEPVYFTDRFRAIKRPHTPEPPTQAVQVAPPRPAAPPRRPAQQPRPSGPVARPSGPVSGPPQPGNDLAGLARPSGPIQRDSADLPRPPAPQRPPTPQRPPAPPQRPVGPRPSQPMNRPVPPPQRPSGPVQRPSRPMPRPPQPPPAPPQDGGKHSLPDDGMHRPAPSPQADRIRRARRHRRDDDE